jgi:transposase-like protein
VAVVQQAYVCGVSTRRVDQLVESLGLRVSRSEVSRICALLDEQVEAFRQRPLEGRYPYLFVDAKVRHEALSDRAGCETPPLGCRSSPVKLRAA